MNAARLVLCRFAYLLRSTACLVCFAGLRARLGVFALIVVLSGGCAAQQSGTDAERSQGNQPLQNTPAASGQFADRNPRYQVRPGDVIEFTFSFTPEFNQTLAVQPDGFVTMKEVGDVYVQGKTVPQITAALRQAYARVLHDPLITVSLKEFEKPHIVVTGEVGHPGKYELRADTTLTEALGIAGGLNDRAKRTQVILFRRVSDDWVEVKQVDVKKLYAGDFREDIHLRPGDMVFVPQSRMSKLKPFLPTSSLGMYMNPAIPR